MSVDPVQPSASDPTPPKPAVDPAGENAETLRAKRRFKRGETEEEGKPDQTIELLSSLLQDLVAKKEQRPPPAAEPAAGTSKTAKYHRLSKTGSGNPAAEVAPAETPAPPPGGSVSAPATPVTPPPVAFRPAPTSDSETERRRLRVWKTLALLGLLASVALAGALVWSMRRAGDRNAPAAKTAPAPASAWTEASLQQLDRALAADQAGDLAEARRLATAIGKPGEVLPPGLTVYLASLDTRQDHTYDAEANLLRHLTTTPPEATAPVYAALAFNFSRTREFDKAADASKNAVLNDPFSASVYYYDGEVARHQGHFPDAIASFRRALERVPTGQPEVASLRDCISLKLRLSFVEQGQESEFQTELDEQLKSSSPSGYWLLTAAAVALQHRDLPAAAGLLGRARDVMEPAQFNALLNDYLFRVYADRKELAEFYPDPATRRAKLLPTMTHTVEP